LKRRTTLSRKKIETEDKKGVNIMPQQDGTGPSGQGARTGRGAGNCNGQGGTGVGRGAGRGLGRGGRGQGRGMGGHGRGLGINANQENSWLQTQLSDLQAAIEKLTEQLSKNK
jgi:hypothetical protein